jgi:serine/threonine protein kinase
VGCLSENTLAGLLNWQLGPDRRAEADAHLEACPTCRERIALFAADERHQETVVERRDSSLAETLVRHRSADKGPLLEAGESVDHYQVLRPLGRGAMGEVYLARDSKLGRKVALKLMRPELFENQEAVARFQHEARAMARVNHPNVVTIHAVGEHRGMPYVAMEYIDGEPLSAKLMSGGVEVRDALRISMGIAEALQEAHKLGVVHRDLKPENVIASYDGRVRVVDFGLAKMQELDNADTFAPTPVRSDDMLETLSGNRIGTPLYMSPEQWKAEETSSAADVWALGIMLHEMLTGTVPFHAQNLVDLARKICDDEEQLPFHASVPPHLRELLKRCLARDHRDRPAIHEVIETLQKASDGERTAPSARPAALSNPPESMLSRGAVPWVIAGAVGLLVGALVIGVVVTSQRESARTPSEPPEPAAALPEPEESDESDEEPTPSETTAGDSTAATAQAGDSTPSATSTSSALAPPAHRAPPRELGRPAPKKSGNDVFAKPPSNAGY